MNAEKRKVVFYISTGDLQGFYTLRKAGVPAIGETVNYDADHYIQNLSTDWEQAVAKTQAIAEQYKAEHNAEVFVDISGEFDLNEWGTGRAAKGRRAIEEKLRIVASREFPFGKYGGSAFQDVPESYLLFWANLANQTSNGTVAQALADECKKYCNETGIFERREAEKQQRFAAQQWVGTVGKRQMFTAKIVFIKSFDTYYGPSQIIKMEDLNGNIIVYFGTAALGKEGETIEFSAAVKAHDTYQGEKQTKVGRPTKVRQILWPEIVEDPK